MPTLSTILSPFILLLSFAVSMPADSSVQSPADGPVQIGSADPVTNFQRLGARPLCSSHYVLQPQDDKCITVVAKFPDMGYGARGLANFYAWNPQVNNPSCNNLHTGHEYCVGAVDLDVVCPFHPDVGREEELGAFHFGG